MYNFKKFLTYLVVGALVMALSVGCSNVYKASDEWGYDIPTTSGYPVNNFTIAVYTGDFTRTKLEVSLETAENRA